MKMKTIVLATALALAVSAPALAKTSDTMHHTRMSHHAMNSQPAFVMPDPAGVYVDGQEIGRDPDANIRATLRDEYYQRQAE
jgi:hypothetical protein